MSEKLQTWKEQTWKEFAPYKQLQCCSLDGVASVVQTNRLAELTNKRQLYDGNFYFAAINSSLISLLIRQIFLPTASRVVLVSKQQATPRLSIYLKRIINKFRLKID